MPEKMKTFVVTYEEVIQHYFRVDARNADEAEAKFHEEAIRYDFSRGEVVDSGVIKIEEDI